MKKTKIFAYVGSKHKNSDTLKVVKRLTELISEKAETEIDIYTPSDGEINICEGCCSCFRKGYCPGDKKDNFSDLKEKLLEADVILLGTPVYAASVSGLMKTFIDRLSYWLHLMPLCGKIVIPVMTASSNSLIETNVYMKKIIEAWGGFVPFSIMCTTDSPAMLKTEEFAEVRMREYAQTVMDYVNGEKQITASKYQEAYFNSLRKKYTYPDDDAETVYWRENNMIFVNSFDELISIRTVERKN